MKRPNIAVILCDQLRPFEIGCYGAKDGNTPNIDALSREGARFETACSPNPVCTPARSCLLAGQYSRTCLGTLFNAEEPVPERVAFPDPTLPELLRSAGYETILTGKWHIAVAPETLGFERAVYPKVHHLNTNQLFYTQSGPRVQEGFAPDYEIATTERFLRERRDAKSARPYFLFHSISLPHMPYFDVPERFRKKFRREDVELRPNVALGDDDFCRDWYRIYLYDYLYYQKLGEQYTSLPEGFGIRDLYALYKSMIACADWQVGRLARLIRDTTPEGEETVILFSSDHGDNMGSHGRFNKDCSYEESIRVPMLLSGPSVPRGGVVRGEPASLIDVAPTLLCLAGLPVPARMQGLSLLPAVRGERLGRDGVCIECTSGEIAVRTAEDKFVLLTQAPRENESQREIVDDAYRFFRLTEDPYELCNLAGSGHEEEAELRERTLRFDAETPWFPRRNAGPSA